MGKSTKYAIERETPTHTVVSQSEKFIQAARELGCDDDEERFIETVRKIAKAPPAPHKGKPKRGKPESESE